MQHWGRSYVSHYQLRLCSDTMLQSINPLMGTLKPHSNGTFYSNTVISTLAVDGWAVTFGTARGGLNGVIFNGHYSTFRPNISNIINTVLFMLLLKTKRPRSLTGRNVRLSNLLIRSCFVRFYFSVWIADNYLLYATHRHWSLKLGVEMYKTNYISRPIRYYRQADKAI